jgi:sulfide dehydrogenase [flavocytochrome c] flavoprotein chain
MIERRRLNRRASDFDTGRRSADRGVVPTSYSGKAAGGQTRENLVVIGCRGVAGANMARFLKLWAGDRLDVTLIEQDCPGEAPMPVDVPGTSDVFAEFFPYDRRSLASRYGIRIIGTKVAGIDPFGHALMLGDGTRLVYDRLEVAPGARLSRFSLLQADE